MNTDFGASLHVWADLQTAIVLKTARCRRMHDPLMTLTSHHNSITETINVYQCFRPVLFVRTPIVV